MRILLQLETDERKMADQSKFGGAVHKCELPYYDHNLDTSVNLHTSDYEEDKRLTG